MKVSSVILAISACGLVGVAVYLLRPAPPAGVVPIVDDGPGVDSRPVEVIELSSRAGEDEQASPVAEIEPPEVEPEPQTLPEPVAPQPDPLVPLAGAAGGTQRR